MADSKENSSSVEVNAGPGSFDEESWEVVNSTDAQGQSPSKKNLECILRDSSGMKKNEKISESSPTIRSFRRKTDGTCLIKVDDKTYALPFVLNSNFTQSEVKVVSGIQQIQHEGVWYKLIKGSGGFLYIQSAATGKYISLHESCSTSDGSENSIEGKSGSSNKFRQTSKSHTGDSSVMVKGIINTFADKNCQAERGIVKTIDEKADKGPESKGCESYEGYTDTKYDVDTHNKSKTCAGSSPGVNTVQKSEGETELTPDSFQMQVGDSEQRFKKELSGGGTDEISQGQSEKTCGKHVDQTCMRELNELEERCREPKTLEGTEKTPVREISVKGSHQKDGRVGVDNDGDSEGEPGQMITNTFKGNAGHISGVMNAGEKAESKHEHKIDKNEKGFTPREWTCQPQSTDLDSVNGREGKETLEENLSHEATNQTHENMTDQLSEEKMCREPGGKRDKEVTVKSEKESNEELSGAHSDQTQESHTASMNIDITASTPVAGNKIQEHVNETIVSSATAPEIISGKEKLTILIKFRKASGGNLVKKMMTLSCPPDFRKYWNFYTRINQGEQMLGVIVGKDQCSVAVSSDDEDLFIFEVCDQYFEHKSQVKQFLNMVINNVYKNAQKSLYLGYFNVEVVIQGDVLQIVKQSKELDAVWIAKASEHDPKTMYAVSRVEDGELLFGKITEIINIARRCFENHEEKVPADSIWQRVISEFGYFEEMNGKFLKTKINYDEKLNAFLLKGFRDESKAAAEHLEKLMKTARDEVHDQNFPVSCQFEIFTNPEMCAYIDSLIQKIPAPFVWIPNQQTQKLHIFSRNPEYMNDIYKSIESCVQEKLFPLSQDQLSLEEYRLLEELKKKHKGKVVVHPSVKALLVTAANDVSESVYAAIQEIFSQEKVTADAVSRQIKPEGTNGKPEHKTDDAFTKTKGLLSKEGMSSSNEICKTIEVHDKQFFKKLLKEDLAKFERLANKCDVTIHKIKKANWFGFELKGSEAEVMCMFHSLSEKIKSKEQQMQLQYDSGIPASSTENVEAEMKASSTNATDIPPAEDEVTSLPSSPPQGKRNQSPTAAESDPHQRYDDDDIPVEEVEVTTLPPSSPQSKRNQSPTAMGSEQHQGDDDGENEKHGKQHIVWTYPNNKVVVLLKDSTCNAEVVILPEIDKGVRTSSSDGKDIVGRISVPLWNKADEKEKHILHDEIEKVLMGVSSKPWKSAGFCINPVGGWDFKHYLKCFLFEINKFCTEWSGKCSVECLFLFTHDEVLYKAASDITDNYLTGKARSSSAAWDYKHLGTMQEGPVFKVIKVSLEKGCLHDAQTEVLVNTISTKLDLKHGAISASLLEKAGPGLQKEISNQLKPPAPYGVVLITGTSQLPSACKAVYHGALKKYNPRDDSAMVLQTFLLSCLQQASKSKYKSIAFPAIGTGNLNFPKDIVSGLMLSTIMKFERSMPNTSLKEVKFVIFPTDTETYKVFKKQLDDFQLHPEEQTLEAKHSKIMPAEMVTSKTLKYGQVQVQAKLGAFENETQNCLLVFWDKQVLWNISDRSKILDSAGSTVIQKWKEHRNGQQFKKDVILVTPGGNLKYTNIIHVACDISTINKAAEAGLMRADREGMKTVVVPITHNDPIQRDVNKFCTGILRAIKDKATSLNIVQSVTLVIQGQHNFPFFNEVFEQESKRYGTRKNTEANNGNNHPVRGIKAVESPRSVPDEPVAQEIPRDEKEVTQETRLQSGIGPEVTLAGNKIHLAQTNKEKCCIILSGDIKSREDLKSHCNLHSNKLKHIVWPYEGKSALVIFEKEVDVKTLEFCTKIFKVEPLPPQLLQNLEFLLVDNLVERVRNTGQMNTLITNLEEISGVGVNQKGGQLFICAVTVHQMDIAKDYLEKFCETKLNIRINKQSKSISSTTEVEKSYNNIDTLVKVSEVEFEALKILENDFERMKNVQLSWENNGTIVIQGPPEFTTYVKTNLSSRLGALRTKQSEEISLNEEEKKVVKGVIGEVQSKDTTCVYDEKKSQVVVYSDKHSDILTFKHKLKFRTGKLKETGRRGKRFADSSQAAEAAQEDFSSSVRLERRRQFSWSKDASDVAEFYTKENIKVVVYMANILNLPVDCIVNAANDSLQHGGGVAKVIADAAGPELVVEGDAIIRKKGKIPVGFQVTTTAGRLPYGCVIHTVGPCWSDYSPYDLQSVQKCEEDLYKAIYGCFLQAEKKELSTIALPAVSSGIYAVPQDMCVVQYARAVQDYSRKSEPRKSLTEIHFIDKLPHLVKLIQDTFKTILKDGKKPNYNVNKYVTSSLSGCQRQSDATGMKGYQPHEHHQHGQPSGLKDAGNSSQHLLVQNVEFSPVYYESGELDKKQSVFQISPKPVVMIYKGDVLKVKDMNAVICPDDKNGSGIGNIASELKRKEMYKKQKEKRFKKEKPGLGDVVITYGEEHPYHAIFHAVVETYKLKKSEFESVMRKCMDNIFKKTNEWVHVKKIAVPLFGVKPGYMTDESWAKLFLDRFIAFCCEFKTINLEEVHIIIHYSRGSTYQRVKKIFNDFYEEANREQTKKNVHPPRPPLPSGYGTENVGIQEPSSEKGHGTTSVEVDGADDCVICMCPMTNPRTLPCGHPFCARCVDELFKHKPVCPACGKIVGILTGDQPEDGRMDVKTSSWQLAGYEGHGSIMITYTFPAGRQGPNHPSTGTFYGGMARTTYLPDTPEGRTVCRMLQLAFDRRLVFTISTSRTTGKEGLTWNDIHHKTNRNPGTEFGYPDPDYLSRVKDELAAKGITEADLPPEGTGSFRHSTGH